MLPVNLKATTSACENHKVETERIAENRFTRFTVSLRNLPCGRISTHCMLININHAVRPHIKLITTSRSALFLEQNQSAVVHVSEVL